jgi:pimeloyl-ACP methyl ester carboxylesterase
VLLLHGLRPRPFSNGNVLKAELHGWQRPGSTLVDVLAREADVYAFAYAQNVAVEQVAHTRALREAVRRLRGLGYRELVLVGHSAGGLVARHFVEDHPQAGVTKVIQVCAPNGGSSWGKATVGVRKNQEVFLQSLTRQGRERCLERRAGKPIPEAVEFVCVVGQMNVPLSLFASRETAGQRQEAGLTGRVGLPNDGVVSCACQWPEDLQEQGIPAVPLTTAHFAAMRGKAGAEKIAELIRQRQPRWAEERVAAARKRLLGAKSGHP